MCFNLNLMQNNKFYSNSRDIAQNSGLISEIAANIIDLKHLKAIY